MLLGAVLGLRTGFTRPSSRWEGEESGRGLARFARAGHGSSDLGWERRAVSQKRQKQEPVTETLMPPNPQSYPDSLFNVPVLHPPAIRCPQLRSPRRAIEPLAPAPTAGEEISGAGPGPGTGAARPEATP